MNNSEDRPEKGGKSFQMPRWGWILATLSLAINLLVVGAVVGSFFAHRHGFWHGPRFMHKDRAFFHSLTSERRHELRKLIHDAREDVRPLWKKAREARRAVGQAMKAEPFDEGALRKALANLTEAEIAARSSSEEMVISVVTKLSAEERKWYAHRFERRKKKRRPPPPEHFR